MGVVIHCLVMNESSAMDGDHAEDGEMEGVADESVGDGAATEASGAIVGAITGAGADARIAVPGGAG